ncbi:MAG: FAD-binding protein [Deltaproteobacteria bacterium]|nr:FAD-binding protein [Deltaproteobacteria bacterium]
MIPPNILNEIADIVGSENLETGHDGLKEYASDGTKLEFMPEAVVFPGNSEEISKILILANREHFPVIPRGAGSGMSGGALPVMKGLVMVMDRFDRIISIDQDNLIAKLEPGVITAHFQKEVARLDLFYPPDPASAEISTIGGNVAECAGGLRAVKYGVTRDYILGLTVVLPTGEIIRTGVETAKGVAGYDLTRLIIGSEGTLAVITSITLRLIPKPKSKKTMTAFFRDLPAAVNTVSHIIREKVVPAALEFLDRQCIECVREEMGVDIPDEAGSMLLIEVDGDPFIIKREMEKIRDISKARGAIEFRTASNEDEAENLWLARRNASPSLMRLGPDKISEDVVVPRSRLAELVSFLEELGARNGLAIPSFGHAGDGNLHVNIMLNKENPDEMNRAQKVIRELFLKVVEMGGTITGEHGVGITKAPYMELELSRPALDLMVRLKKAFDPNGILNPGKMSL